ncbi:MAG: aldehyde ferredoxin oxidoreductase family protein, partial [Anaerolineae bacterium]|nr:aldehyde ferredoxin oxidoreductase family protein [Anaerolineae bacterium]
FVICALSPATGLWGESNCGGFWGPELRKAGFDGVFITGKSESPVYVSIMDGEASIQPADHVWGRETYDAQEIISAELNNGKTRVATIGPAGEALIPFALVLTDHGRVAGRTGMGAVMGSKNLKAIAVRGTGDVPVIDEAAYAPVRSRANRDLRQNNMTDVFQAMGSACGSDYFDYLGEMPKKGFTRGEMDTVERVSGATITDTLLVGYTTCHACVIACGRLVQIADGEKRKGPEYETLIGFGPNLWIDDPEAITMMGELCDRYGMDTISLSNTISLAFTLYELGLITQEDTGGIELLWGDTALVMELIHLAIKREGFGAYLAEGARALGRRFGSEDRAVQVNGLEVPYHDPRGASGMALVYATSPRGACHNQSDYFVVDIGQVESSLGMELFSRHDGPEKAANVAIHQNWVTMFNSLVTCIFANVPPRTTVELINSAMGLDWSIEDTLMVGERAWNLKRAINNRLGLGASHDRLPQTLLEALPDGGAAGYKLDLPAMLSAYYRERGWDPESGYPRKEKLIELGLDWVAEDLYPSSK